MGFPALLKLRQDFLHTTNSTKVLKEIDKLVSSKKLPLTTLENGNEDAVNILKYISRLHGLPTSFQNCLHNLLQDRKLKPSFTYKVSLALKYAVGHNSDFISISQLMQILFGFPTNHDMDDFTKETISQLMLTIIKILNPDKLAVEKISEDKLWQLETYLVVINGKFKSEVRRSLEKMGYWSGSVVNRRKAHRHLKTGDEVISEMHKKKGLNVSAHVVKTQQTEAVTTEENVSEKTQMSNISLSNALEQGRARTLEAARARETLPPLKSAEGSVLWWYQTTLWCVDNLLDKARGKQAISPQDVQYLRDKFDGFKTSFWKLATFTIYDNSADMIKMIAETFCIISKYQKLDDNIIKELLEVALSHKFELYGARFHILQACDNHCNRISEVPPKIHQILTAFWSEEGSESSDEIKDVITDILFSDPDKLPENLKLSIEALKIEKSCIKFLNFIQRQFGNKKSRAALENETSLVPALITALETFQDKHTIAGKVLEVLEDYLELGWTFGFKPEQLQTLVKAASAEVNDDLTSKSIRCVLLSMEKGLEVEDYFKKFSAEQLESQFQFLFEVVASEMKGTLQIFTLVMLSKVLDKPELREMTRLANHKHVEAIRNRLEKKDVLLKQGDSQWKVVVGEELTSKFFEEPPEDEHHFVSDFVAKLMVTIGIINPASINDDQTISLVSRALLNSVSKMTRILCAESLFRVVSTSELFFSTPVLNRIQPEVFSQIGDIHVYITAAHCTSLSNQARSTVKLLKEHVNFLVNLYAQKKVTLDQEDFSPWINPKILQVFQLACQSGVEISEQVFHLMALILNNTCADSEESLDYPVVKTILEMVTDFCHQDKFQATSLPPAIVEAVENLLLESDVFDETCAGIIELCMLAGRWVSDNVVEEFAKYLWHEPAISIPMLRRLSIANENQELPQNIFSSFQMELIGLRLYPTEIHPEGETVLSHQKLQKGDANELFLVLSEYISSGMLISRLNLEVILKLLQKWSGKQNKSEKEEVIRSLTCTASNGQSLPKKLVELSLKDDFVTFAVQLDFATAVVLRSQPIPDKFLSRVYSQLNGNSDLTQSEVGRRILNLIKTMILHNEQLPPDVVSKYCAAVANTGMMTSDILASLRRLVETEQVTSSDRENYAEIFDNIMESRAKVTKAVPTKHELLQAIKTSDDNPDLSVKWTPVWREELDKAVESDLDFLQEVGKNLDGGSRQEFIVEVLCAALASDKMSKDCEELSRRLVEGLKDNMNEVSYSYLNHSKEDIRRWALGLSKVEKVQPAPEKKKQSFIGKLFKNKSKPNPKLSNGYQVATSILNQYRSRLQPQFDKEDMTVFEDELINGDGLIPSAILEAYYLTLLHLKLSPKSEEVCKIFTLYLKDNPSLEWTDKRHILSIFLHLASTNQLPQPVMEAVKEFVLSTDSVVRSLSFAILLTLRGRDNMKEVWRTTYLANLYTVYKTVCGSVDKEDLRENKFTTNLCLTLQTLSFIDLKALQNKEEEEWPTHLMAADTILSLASSIDEQLELFPVAKELCSKLQDKPLERLFILKKMKDYLSATKTSISAARLLQLLALSENGAEDIWHPDWIQNVICSGYSALLSITSISVKVVIKQFLQSMPIHILDQVVTVLIKCDDKPNTHLFRQLLQFITENQEEKALKDKPKSISKAEAGYPAETLLAYLQTSLLTSLLPNGDKISLIENHTRYLLVHNYDYSLLSQIFAKIAKKVKAKDIPSVQGLNILENILCQIHTYQVAPEKLQQIYGGFKGKKISEWVGICNGLVMEDLYSGSQGVKTAKVIATDFEELNNDNPEYLSGFHETVKNIQEGHFQSCLNTLDITDPFHSPRNISDFTITDIRRWASEARSKEVNWSADMINEALAVISRACLINRNYHLSPIQILSVHSTLSCQTGILLQVATGSGKSTIIAALAIIKSLMGFTVDVYTSSPVLAERDAKSWAPFYSIFNLSCDHNGDKGSGYTKGEKTCYKKDIVYGDTSQFQFDALRHDYSSLGTRGTREYGFAIVDEVDSMFVDDSSKLARLSSTLPGMDLLQIVYHLIWQRLHDIQQRLFAVGTGTYYLEGKRSVDDKGNLYYAYLDKDGTERTLQNLPFYILQNIDNPDVLENALIFKVSDIDQFVVDHLKKYTRALIGDEEFAENGKKVETLALPKFLKTFAKSQISNWVDSALTAVTFQENVHYVIDHDLIKPVDYQSTGIIQASTNWINGLHQFLQIKHCLKVTTETVTTNFLSNMAMFQKYGGDLVGFSGTLGSKHGQGILKEVYGVEALIIPELYYNRFQPLVEHVLIGDWWMEKIVNSALHESSKGRAVLVICQTIKEAEQISEQLEKENTGKGNVKLYTRNDFDQEKHVQQVYEGDIIVATNLAGRGTDINTTKVEAKGGLHVILGFLPDSLRVEDQAFGRTARQGNKGSGELVLKGTDKPEELKRIRDEGERMRLEHFKDKELTLIQTKDKLFAKFCKTYSEIRSEMKSGLFKLWGMLDLSLLEQTRLQAIEQRWAVLLKKVDDGEIDKDKADHEYDIFEADITATYKDVDKTISACENCFYWIQFGNEYYRRWNVTKDNTGEAQKWFEKGIKADPEFAAGGHAGVAFCLLKGKTKVIGKNSHGGKYKHEALKHMRECLRICYTEISLYTTVQTLLQHRGGRSDSELFKQLTEKVNLVGEYARNVEGIISTLEKSLRAVYLTEVTSGEKWVRLDDDNPKVKGERSSRYQLEFHDLTFTYDCGRDDQAANTIGEYDNVTINLHNQSLGSLLKTVKRSKVGSVQLNGVSNLRGVRHLLTELEYKGTFTLGVNAKKNFLKELEGRKASVTWQDGDITFKKSFTLSEDINFPDDANLQVELNLKDTDLEGLSLEGNQDLYLVLEDLSEKQIRKGWTIPDKNKPTEDKPGLLQQFNRNKITFKTLKNSKAKEVINALRDNNISFELKLENLTYHEAIQALRNSGRVQEEIDQKGLKEMGYQFSSTYIPLEIIRDLIMRGLVLLPEFTERAFVPWRSVIAIGILASVQVAAGAVLVCTGFGATVGMGLITEGMADFTTAYRVYSTREFSWKDYAIQKAVSLTISVVSMGLSSLKDGAKGVATLGQAAATEAGERMATGVAQKTLNKGIEVAGSNLRSLVVKQVAVQGVETVARVGLNSVMDSIVQFSFESVKEHLSSAVEETVKREFQLPQFIAPLSVVAAMDKGVQAKVSSWMNEVTNPQSGNWNKAWDQVGYPLCQGILSDPQYLGSSFSMGLRLIGVINGCKEISTVALKVCGHITEKMEAERKSLSPAYLIQEQLGVTSAEADEIVAGTEFGKESAFHVKSFPNCKDKDKLKELFKATNKSIKDFKAQGDLPSRIIASVRDHLASHITHVANRQLVSPVTTLAVGKLVSSISQQIQSKYLVSDAQMSEDQLKVKQLKEKEKTGELSAEERTFLERNDRPVTFADQIRGNAKDYTVSYQKRDIIAAIMTISQDEKKVHDIPDKFTKQSEQAIDNILDGGPADMTTVFMLAELNDADVKLVDDPKYIPTEEDKAKGLKIVCWESPKDGQPVGHYTLKDTASGKVTEFVGGGANDCAYNVLSAITGKPAGELRLQAATFIACNQDKFQRVSEGATWIRERYPEEANNMLHVGGAKKIPTDVDLSSDDREVRYIGTDSDDMTEEGEEGDINWKKYILSDLKKTLVVREGEGSTPEKKAEATIAARKMKSALSSDPDTEFTLIENGQEEGSTYTVRELRRMFGKRFISGHWALADFGAEGVDENLAPISDSLNRRMSLYYEGKTKEFVREGIRQGLIKEGDKPLKTQVYGGAVDILLVNEEKLPIYRDITCIAHLNTDNPALQQLFEQTFSNPPVLFRGSAMERPAPESLFPQRDDTGRITGYGATFLHQRGSLQQVQPKLESNRDRALKRGGDVVRKEE